MNINKSDIVEYFESGIKKDSNCRIGIEHEKFLFDKNTQKRIDYTTIRKLFNELLDYSKKKKLHSEPFHYKMIKRKHKLDINLITVCLTCDNSAPSFFKT
mgnify:CR=1 FL=1